MNRAHLPSPRAGTARQAAGQARSAQGPARVLLGALMLVLAATAQAQDLPANCGGLKNHYGPWDYRVNRGETLDIVERAHFTPKVEMLIRGNTGSIGQDLAYTLRTFPNHHRALLTAERFAERAQNPQPKDMEFTVECYYRRAIAWKPDDSIARLLFARFLFKEKREPEAKNQLAYVLRQKEANAFTIYNVGMVAFEFKDYELAASSALRAREMGFEGTVLIDQLKAQGKWTEAAAAEPAASAASSPAGAASVAQDSPK